MKTTAAPRERILLIAARLFYGQGVRATGIDQIIAEAGVAKATLYYHFPAKTDLVRTYLQQRHHEWMQEFSEQLNAVGRHGLSSLADALGHWFESGNFNGCAFINLTAESSEPEWRQVSCAHKDALRDVTESLLSKRLSPTRRAKLSAQALLVIEGTIIRYQMTRDPAVIANSREVLKLIEKNVE